MHRPDWIEIKIIAFAHVESRLDNHLAIFHRRFSIDDFP